MRSPTVELPTPPRSPEASGPPKQVPPEVRDRIERGSRAIAPMEPEWQEALAFFDDEQWFERSASNGSLQPVENREGGSKPRWRSRLTRNRYTSAILEEKSALLGRSPVPEASAPSGNPEDINAAKLSAKAALSAHHKLGIANWVGDALHYALNCGGGYVWPYWNAGLGKFLTDPQSGETLRVGEIDAWVLAPSEVLYEPGVDFEKSRWYCVRKAQAVDHVMDREDYTGPQELKPDAAAAPNERGRDGSVERLVFVYHYLERPSSKHKLGRWLQIAGGGLIAEQLDYPCDEDIPVLHAIEDIERPHRSRPMGRGRLMLDIQRTYNRTINQIIQWKNLVLVPQLLAPKGSVKTQPTGEPGQVIEYVPKGAAVPAWREVPEIPVSMFRVLDQCISDWQEITGQSEPPAGLESGSAVTAWQQRGVNRRQEMVNRLAAFYGGIYEHVLYLMQRHYTEPRILEVKGRFGTETLRDFLGAKLMPGVTVHVSPASIEPRTREAQEAKIIMFAERGWLAPHQVMAALRSGNADSIIDDFELDVAKANREIQQLMAMGRDEGFGPVFAGPADNHQLHQDVLGSWMKTEDFERQDELVKQATLAHYQQHSIEQQIQVQQQQMTQALAAAANGMGNASGMGGPGGAGAPEVSMPALEGTVAGLQGQPRAQ